MIQDNRNEGYSDVPVMQLSIKIAAVATNEDSAPVRFCRDKSFKNANLNLLGRQRRLPPKTKNLSLLAGHG